MNFFKDLLTRRASPGSILLLLAAMPTSALTLYSLAPPAGFTWLVLLAPVLWAAIGLGWLIMLFTRQRSLLLLLPPVLVVGTLALLWVGPTELGFAVSKRGLAHHAETLEPGRAGIFTLDEPTSEEGIVMLPIRDTGFIFTESGFLYAPGGIPDDYGEGYESFDSGHLEGPWYWYISQS